MKLIIAGGRNYRLTPADYDRLAVLRDACDRAGDPITEVVSGCSVGVDTAGEDWAKRREIPVNPFPANWKKFGDSAGPRRNEEMAKYADAVVLFPGGKGTESMFHEAKKAGIRIFDWRTNEPCDRNTTESGKDS